MNHDIFENSVSHEFAAGVKAAIEALEQSPIRFVEPKLYRIKGQVWHSEYTGCEGWRDWPARFIVLEGSSDDIYAQMKAVENEIAPTYIRRTVHWQKLEIIE
jgi:hypothetical protein